MDLARLDSHAPTSNIAYSGASTTFTSFGAMAIYFIVYAFMGRETTKHHQNIPTPSCNGNLWAFSISRLSHRRLTFDFLLLSPQQANTIPLKCHSQLCHCEVNSFATCDEGNANNYRVTLGGAMVNKDNPNKKLKTHAVTPEFLLRHCARFRWFFRNMHRKNSTLWLAESGCHCLLLRPSKQNKSAQHKSNMYNTNILQHATCDFTWHLSSPRRRWAERDVT